MAASTWSTTDKSNVTLTGSNLIATASANSGAIRGKDPKRTGKYYIEYTSGTLSTGSQTGFAAGHGTLGTATMAGSVGAGAGNAILSSYDFSGTAQATGSSTSNATAGLVLCCAIDLDNRLLWTRIGAAGNWNASATANPATGIGGYSLAGAGLGVGVDVYPYVFFQTSGNALTANFGGSAFTGTVPSGFTSGWDDSASVVLNVVASQTAAEVWGTSSPAVQVTQTALEVWAKVNTWLAHSDMARETLLSTSGDLRMSGVVREVLRSSGTGAGTFLAMGGIVREVLRSSAASVQAFVVVMA